MAKPTTKAGKMLRIVKIADAHARSNAEFWRMVVLLSDLYDPDTANRIKKAAALMQSPER